MASHETMPDLRGGPTRKFSIPHVMKMPDGSETRGKLRFYVTANTYPDGRLGEILIKGDKMGDFVTGALNAFAIVVSVGLQHGVPLSVFIEKLRHMKFEPAGFTGDQEFPSVSSAMDYVAQWLAKRFS